MRLEVSALRRRALGLQGAGLLSLAEHSFRRWWGAAEVQDNWGAVAEAAMCAVRLAVDRNRPTRALAVGAQALPQVLGRSHIAADVMGRLFILLAKAAWSVGQDAEVRAFADAARNVVENAPVEPLVRIHHGIIQSMMAIDADDLASAEAWLLQAVDVAEAVGDASAADLCRLNLTYIWAERGKFEQAQAAVESLLAHGVRDSELVDVLVNGVHVALGRQDITQAGSLARRAVQAYCETPSMLSPISVGYLFEALAVHQAAAGALRAAELLGGTARAWFALRNRRREVARIEQWLAEVARRSENVVAANGEVDPDALYLGELYDGVRHAADPTMAEGLAATVHHLLGHVEPQAPTAPSEHAALLRGLTPRQRWFTGRSAVGQAAEFVLSEPTAPGRAGLEVLALYEQLAVTGASWTEMLRGLRRAGNDATAIVALDTLYRQATA